VAINSNTEKNLLESARLPANGVQCLILSKSTAFAEKVIPRELDEPRDPTRVLWNFPANDEASGEET
jgi:hypothetical protein